MDPILTAAMKDDSFGSDWRPGTGGGTGKKRGTGRRAFFRRGVAAAASALAVSAGRKAFARQSQLPPQPVSGREREGVRGDPDA